MGAVYPRASCGHDVILIAEAKDARPGFVPSLSSPMFQPVFESAVGMKIRN